MEPKDLRQIAEFGDRSPSRAALLRVVWREGDRLHWTRPMPAAAASIVRALQGAGAVLMREDD